jgi:outer membrane protein TolC
MSKQALVAVFLLAASLDSTGADVVPLSLGKAIDYAFDRRLEVRNAQLSVEISTAEIKELESQYLPTIDAKAGAYRQDSSDNYSGIEVDGLVSGMPVEVSVDRTLPKYQTNVGVEARLKLLDGGKRKAQVAASKARLSKAQAESYIVRRGVALEVAEALIGFIRAKQVHSLAQDRNQLQSRVVEIRSNEYTGGSLSEINFRKADVVSKRRKRELKEARRELKQRWEAYLKALRCPANVKVKDIDDYPVEINLEKVKAVLETRFQYDRELELEIKKMDLLESNQRLQESRASYRPEVDIFASYGFVGRDDQDFGDAVSDTSSGDFIVGLEMRWNLFSGGKRHASEQKALLRQLRAQNDILIETAKSGIRKEKLDLDVESAQDDMQLAREELDLQLAVQAIKEEEHRQGEIADITYLENVLKTKEVYSEWEFSKLDVVLALVRKTLG